MNSSSVQEYSTKYSEISNIICRALQVKTIPCRSKLRRFRVDGKRGDGVTLTTYSNGKILHDSHIQSSSIKVGSVMTADKTRHSVSSKCNNYKNIVEDNHIFLPFVCGTLGTMVC